LRWKIKQQVCNVWVLCIRRPIKWHRLRKGLQAKNRDTWKKSKTACPLLQLLTSKVPLWCTRWAVTPYLINQWTRTALHSQDLKLSSRLVTLFISNTIHNCHFFLNFKLQMLWGISVFLNMILDMRLIAVLFPLI